MLNRLAGRLSNVISRGNTPFAAAIVGASGFRVLDVQSIAQDQADRWGSAFTDVFVVLGSFSLFSGVLQFAAAHGGLPVFIAEWGSVPYADSSVRVNWIQQMQSFVAGNPSIHAALYWNSSVQQCNYILNNSSTSLSALASMGHSSLMQGKPA